MVILTKEAVQALLDEFLAAWNRGDIEAACSHYATDALFMVPNHDIIRGKSEIIKYYRATFPHSAAMDPLKIEIVDFRTPDGSGDDRTMAVAIERYEVQTQHGDKNVGFAMLVYELRDDKIVIIRDASV